MNEQFQESKPREEASRGDINDFVEKIAQQLKHTGDVFDARSIIDPMELLSHIQNKSDAMPVDLTLKVGSHVRHLHSDDFAGIHRGVGAVQQLEALSLTRAKLRYAEQQFPDHPALRGFTHGLDLKVAALSKAIIATGWTAQEIGSKIKKVGRLAIATVGFAIAACRGGVSVGEIPTAEQAQAAEAVSADAATAAEVNTYLTGILGSQIVVSLSEDSIGSGRLMQVDSNSTETISSGNGIPAEFHFAASNGDQINLTLSKVTLKGDKGQPTDFYFFIDAENNELGNVYMILVKNKGSDKVIYGDLIPNSSGSIAGETTVTWFEQHDLPDQQYAPLAFQLVPKQDGTFVMTFTDSATQVRFSATLSEQESERVAHLAALTPILMLEAPTPNAESDASAEENVISYDLENPANYSEIVDGTVTLSPSKEPVGPFPYRFNLVTDFKLLDRPGNNADFLRVTTSSIYNNDLRNGESAQDAVSTEVLWAIYKCWQNNIDDPTLKTERAQVGMGQFVQMMVEAQRSGDYTPVFINVSANDMNANNDIYTEQLITDVNPFQITVVVLDINSPEAAKNTRAAENKDDQRLQPYGTGVFVDENGVNRLVIFLPGLYTNLSVGVNDDTFAAGLTRLFTPGWDAQREQSRGDVYISPELRSIYQYSGALPAIGAEMKK